MPFGATANPDTVPPLTTGQTQDVVITFTDVPTDATGSETITVGSQQVLVSLTFLAVDPESSAFTVPAGYTRDLISIDDAQMVVRYTGV